MRCRKHPTDLSSSVGVCASCLRERLFAVAEAQPKPAPECRKSHEQQQSTPLAFPRSASPYISRRQSDTSRQWFYGTPLAAGRTDVVEIGRGKRGGGGGGRFSSVFWGFFRSRSDSGTGNPPESCSASPSWLSAIVPRRRKKQSGAFTPEESAAGAGRRKGRRDRDRGMSPARCSVDEHFHGGASGYSSESSQGWTQTPRRTPTTARRGRGRGAGHGRNVSTGLGFCLSPLVRPSPNRHRNQKGAPPAEAGESRVPAKGHLSTSASLCRSGSRKLADFGRYTCSTNKH